jgi:hypothetical protein
LGSFLFSELGSFLYVFVQPRLGDFLTSPFSARASSKFFDGGVREGSMAREQFFVVLREGEWKIKYNGQHSRPYRSKAGAVKDAIDQAHAVHQKGGLSQVLVQGEDMTFRERHLRRGPISTGRLAPGGVLSVV